MTPGNDDDPAPVCVRCGKQVTASATDYETFERMHYVCFHYEFEHRGDPDIECTAGGCPTSGLGVGSLLFRVQGADIAHERDTAVPAILALRQLGFTVEQHTGGFVARNGWASFTAGDPVSLLGLVKLAETRHPWSASAVEIEEVHGEFDL